MFTYHFELQVLIFRGVMLVQAQRGMDDHCSNGSSDALPSVDIT